MSNIRKFRVPGSGFRVRSLTRNAEPGTRNPQRLFVYGLLTVAGVLSLFPLYWLFVTSLSPQQFIIKVPPDLLPRSLTFQNYQRLFGTTPVIRWLFNTLRPGNRRFAKA